MNKLLSIILEPVEVIWRESEKDGCGKPIPRVMRVALASLSTVLMVLLLYALVRGLCGLIN